MTDGPIHDWSCLGGMQVRILLYGKTTDNGTVDTAAPDGTVLWLSGHGATQRRLYAKAEDYEAWPG